MLPKRALNICKGRKKYTSCDRSAVTVCVKWKVRVLLLETSHLLGRKTHVHRFRHVIPIQFIYVWSFSKFQNRLSINEFIWVHLFHSLRPCIDTIHFVIHFFFILPFFLVHEKAVITPYLSPKSVYWSDPKYIFGITFEVLSLYSKAGPSETDDVDDKLPLSKSLQGITFLLPFSHITVLMWCSLYRTDCVLVLISVLLLF